MTISEAVQLADKLKPNDYPFALKVSWLSTLDGQIYNDIVKTHEGGKEGDFPGYPEYDPEAELLVPYPYARDIYNYYLQAQIDRENGEADRYNQTITMYNTAFIAFQSWYNRENKPKARRAGFIF